jgi:uncharacterized membrane protein HdeD (DUF308 family)
MRSSLIAGILCIILGLLIHNYRSVYGNPVPASAGIAIIICGITWIIIQFLTKLGRRK